MKLKGIFRVLPIIRALFAAGCDDNDGTKVVEKVEPNPGRFTTQYMGYFNASTYDRAKYRSIYMITDNKTKVEYLAVEGCGTARLVNKGKQGMVEE